MTKHPTYVDAEYDILPQTDLPASATYESIVRLLVGALLVGSDELLKRARAWELTHPPSAEKEKTTPSETDLVLLRHLIVGSLFLGPSLISRPLLSFAETTDRAFNLAGSLLGPFMRIPILRPAHGLWESYQDRIGAIIKMLIAKGKQEGPYSKAMAQELLPDLISDAAIATSQRVDGIQEVVRDQVSKYLTYAMENPDELEALVQLIGDHYLQYLKEENPEALQEIVQGQSLSLASEITDELRARTVTADTVVEMFMRSILRRPARQDLPLPPEEIMQQARLSTQEVLSARNTEKKDE